MPAKPSDVRPLDAGEVDRVGGAGQAPLATDPGRAPASGAGNPPDQPQQPDRPLRSLRLRLLAGRI